MNRYDASLFIYPLMIVSWIGMQIAATFVDWILITYILTVIDMIVLNVYNSLHRIEQYLIPVLQGITLYLSSYIPYCIAWSFAIVIHLMIKYRGYIIKRV